MNIQNIIFELRRAQIEMAELAMSSPDKDNCAFQFGKVKGHYKGLEQAISIIEQMLTDEES